VVATNLAYPVGDLLLLTTVGVALAVTGWRPGRAWALVTASLLLTACADALYSYLESAGIYASGSILSTAWPAAVVIMGIAAWQPRRRVTVRTHGTAVHVPAGFALLALALLLYGWVADLPLLSGILAAAGLLAAMVRGALTFRENVVLLRRSHEEALTDGLSGLPNRRRLTGDLEDALADAGARTLLFFDLDGFKAYNDAFGHSAGDALLARLGGGLAEAVDGRGTAYRLGGDEFCVLLDGKPGRFDSTLSRGRGAERAWRGIRRDRLLRGRADPERGGELRGGAAARRRADVRAQGLATGDPAAPGAERPRSGARGAGAGAPAAHGRRRRAGAADRARARARHRGARRARPRGRAARHRQGGGARRHPQQAGAAGRRRVADHAPAHAGRRAHPRRRAGAERGRAAGAAEL
jgi:GGDEF domain-containing protein